jgi:hypothetical protein
MSTATNTAGTTRRSSSLAASRKFGTFAITFSICGPVIYCLVQYFNYPLVTYWPAIGRLVWGLESARPNSGPNMLWYGWVLTTVIIAGALGIVAMFVPERIIKKIPLWLVWLFPILAVPYVVYSLMYWWRLAARQ